MKVSIVIPAYNAEFFLEQAISSALSVRHRDLDIVIVDDGSVDRTLEIARGLASTYPDIVRVLTHEFGVNRGAAASRNLGIASARGDLVAFLDADDWYLPHRFDFSVRKLASDRRLDGIVEMGAVSYESSEQALVGPWDARELIGVPSCEALDLTYWLSTGHSWQMNAITLRREVFRRSGFFNERLLLGEDLELWIRLSCVAELARGNALEPVAVYRRHPGNRSMPDRYDEMIRALSEAHSWARRHSVSSAKLECLQTGMYEYVFGHVSELVNQSYPDRARKLLWQFARAHKSALLVRRFWANMARLLVRHS